MPATVPCPASSPGRLPAPPATPHGSRVAAGPALHLLLSVFPALLIAAAARGSEPAELVRTFCQECHAEDRVEGDVDLTGLTPEAMRRDVATWQRATEMVVTGQMPPREAAQPSADQRAALAAWLGGFLRAEARAHAGDPGRVVLGLRWIDPLDT